MPQRVNPTHDFGPCTLNRESIERITEILMREFPSVQFAAEDGIWEVYDEKRKPFLAALTNKKRLDVFRAAANAVDSVGEFNDMRIAFDATQAMFRWTVHISEQHRVEHVIQDIRMCLLPASLTQRVALMTRGGRWLGATSFVSAVTRLPVTFLSTLSTGPYSSIILEKRQPNPFWKSIRANLVSNAIWAILGALLLLLLQFLSTRFGWRISLTKH